MCTDIIVKAFLVRNINNYQYRYTEFIKLDGFDSALLKYLSSTAKKVCLVIVDYAALSIDPDDTLLLVKYVFILGYLLIKTYTLTLTQSLIEIIKPWNILSWVVSKMHESTNYIDGTKYLKHLNNWHHLTVVQNFHAGQSKNNCSQG